MRDKQTVKQLLAAIDVLESVDFKDLRRRVDLSQEKAARYAEVSARTWLRWEQHGRERPAQQWLEPIKRFCERVLQEAQAT